MMREAKVDHAACAAAVADPMLLATDLADYLVNRGVPFRKAHEIIGRAVALSASRGLPLPQISLADYQSLSPVCAEDLFTVFDLATAMSARAAIGAPAPANVATQLARWEATLR